MEMGMQGIQGIADGGEIPVFVKAWNSLRPTVIEVAQTLSLRYK